MVPPASFVTSPFTAAPSLTTTQSALPLLLTPSDDPGPLTTTDELQATAAPPLAVPTASAEHVGISALSQNPCPMHNHPGEKRYAM